MPTPVAAARQCLSPAAVAALDAAVASARRRAHAQTTSLHLISSLLAPAAPPLLRDALARARSAAYSPRLQLKALELCFAVSLDRLPSAAQSSSSSPPSSGAAGGGAGDEPPVANSLMAAIKRSQANQRRNPDTFHFYHQAQAQAPSAVKVDLSHLVLAILDDPLVSRVFADAGFRSGDIKLAILRPAPPMPLLGRLPARARPPPLFLCSFAAADDADVPSPAGAAGAGEENCRRIAEILSRGRNPMLVGVGAAAAAAEFAASSPYRILAVGPASIDHAELVAAAAAATSGLVISIGDLKDLVPDEAEPPERGPRVVAEVTRALETHRARRVWVMGWSATYETYLAFLSKFPLVDKDWELQLLPITAVRDGGGGAGGAMPPASTVAALSKPPATPSASLMESFVPFGGFCGDTYEANSLKVDPCPQALRCQQCNDRYEQEVATIIRGSGIRTEDNYKTGVPSLMQNVNMMGPNSGFDAVKVRDDQMVLNSKILNLQKKWNEYCLRLHQGCQRINRDPYQLFPHCVGVPADRERAANPSKGPETVALPRAIIKPSAVSASHTNTTATSISLPFLSNQRNEDLMLELQVRQSKSDEHLQDRAVQPQHGSLSNCDIREPHASPSSAAPVATDLVLGTPRESSSKYSSSAQYKHVQDAEGPTILVPNKVDDLNLKPPQLFVQPYSCSRSSSNCGQTSPSALHSAVSGVTSAFGQWQRPSPLAAQSPDLSNYKLLVERLFKAVGRQEEALSTICQSLVRCQSMGRHRDTNKKNDIWFNFHGADSIAKRRVAAALAELMYGSSENLIYLDLSLQDWGDSGFRGKTGTDFIVEELRKKHRSVIFLDNFDKADCLVQDSLSSAMETGRFCSFQGGRVVDLNDSIVILSTRMIRGCKDAFVGMEEGHSFSEEKVLAARARQMKILVEQGAANISESLGAKVLVSSMHSDANIQASLHSGYVSKRKLNISGCQEKLQQSSSTSKRLHRSSSAPFDLNLPVDEAESHDADDDNSSHDNSCSDPDGSIDNLLHSVDDSVNFKPFDFGKLSEDVLQEFSNTMGKILGSKFRLEIDVAAMEQILAAAWVSDAEKRPVQTWLQQVFARSLEQLKLKCKNVSSSTLRLVACEDAPAKDEGFGAFLPSRIILD
ncbi:hypothetical protein ACP4OV_003571 [Aristida adscensionis]